MDSPRVHETAGSRYQFQGFHAGRLDLPTRSRKKAFVESAKKNKEKGGKASSDQAERRPREADTEGLPRRCTVNLSLLRTHGVLRKPSKRVAGHD